VERVIAAVTIDAVLDLENRYGIATEIALAPANSALIAILSESVTAVLGCGEKAHGTMAIENQ